MWALFGVLVCGTSAQNLFAPSSCTPYKGTAQTCSKGTVRVLNSARAAKCAYNVVGYADN
jgi:hypothetical protein